MITNITRRWNRFSRLNRRHKLTAAEKKLRTIRLLRLFSIGMLGAFLVGLVLFFIAFAWVSRNLPKPGEIVRKEGFNTRILDRNGELIHNLYEAERRDPVPIEEIPDHLKQATIAIEDKDFYKHQGFDFLTVLRIPYYYLTGGRVVGGSTLTQQLVKNVLLTNERTVIRKFKEFVLSLQIERRFTKDEILAMYLNEVPYGGVSLGVGAASQSYFGKNVGELSLAQSAVLAGLPQRPSAYSPFLGRTDEDGNPLWKLRSEGVLRRMVEDGYITKIDREEAMAEIEQMEFTRQASGINAPHFIFYIEEQLNEMFGEELLKRGGLEVTTTLDLELQNSAQEIVAAEVEKVEGFNITNGAAMAMNPNTGEILSMVGSRDFFSEDTDGQFNVAVNGLRQPGSSIKPITYLAMFQQGHTPATVIVDAETTFTPDANAANPYQPKNYDGQFRGPVSIRNALGSSLNVPAVKSMAMVGVDNWLALAYEMGFPTLEPTQENMKRFGLSATLGGAEVHLIDTVTAYSAFANGGNRVEPISILKVQNLDGQTLFENKPTQGRRVITEGEAFLINDILSDNNARLLAFGPSSLLNMGAGVSVKTGTTNDQRDNWTIGWNTNVIVGTWVGNNDFSAMKQVASGVTGASPIWRNILTKAISLGYSTKAWERPSGVEQVEVDKISGYPKHDEFETKFDFFLNGTIPALPDPIHTKIRVCKSDENKLATDAIIAKGDSFEKEFVVLKEEDPVSQDGINRWQQGIDAWISSQDNKLYKVPTEYCGDVSDVAVRLAKPQDKQNFNNEEIEVRIEADSGDGIEKIELWVKGESGGDKLRETINSREYEGTIHLPKGRYEIYAKAFSRSGKEAKSNTVRIGTGGEDWEKKSTPTPTPTPTATPTPTPPIIEI